MEKASNKRYQKPYANNKKPVKRKKNAKSDAPARLKPSARNAGPIWTRPPGNGPLHPSVDLQLIKPVLRNIIIDKNTRSFQYQVKGGKYRPIGGMHLRLEQKFFGEIPKRKPVFVTDSNRPRRLASSAELGTRAERVLEEALGSGKEPPPVGSEGRGTSDFAAAVWDYWKSNGHTPILAQLPVILFKANIGTAGDFFTTRTNPDNGREELWLWELKTGWPDDSALDHRAVMKPPLAHVWLTTWNRWHVQLMLTRMAYERELGMKIDQAHVIHTWMERPQGSQDYVPMVQLIDPEEHLSPSGWPSFTDANTIYESI